MYKGIFILNLDVFERIYPPFVRRRIEQHVEWVAPPHSAEMVMQNPAVLHAVEVIFSGWGCITFTPEVLQAAPKLRAVFYGAGSIRGIVTPEFWQRGILITSAYKANAVAVAEFTLGEILLSLKRFWQHAANFKQNRAYERLPVPGAYRTTVGLVSLGAVGGRVADLLRNFDLQVIAYDPFVSPQRAAELSVELCSLEEVFRRAEVVSLHTPWIPETEGMIRGEHFAAMKPGATFINTARGAVIRENEMIAILQQRPDLFALLDVTHPEPPLPDSPLYTLPNVILTPHIAGVMDAECGRMGAFMAEELEHFIRGEPLQAGITQEQAKILA